VREAIIQLGDRELEAIGLDGIVAATRDAGPRDVTELVCHGAGGILQVRVEEPTPEADLDRLGSVRWWERLTAPASGVTYLCKIEPTNDPEEPVLDEHATAHEVSAVREDGIDLSVVGSQDGIGRSVAAIDEAGMSPLLCRLTDYEGPRPRSTARPSASARSSRRPTRWATTRSPAGRRPTTSPRRSDWTRRPSPNTSGVPSAAPWASSWTPRTRRATLRRPEVRCPR